MKPDQAAENLQVIRTLMERSAVYRRALAPIMTFVGSVGLIGAFAGIWARISSKTAFINCWLIVAVIAVIGSFVLVRRQALKSSEPFWSPPTRRVAQALLPPLFIGLFVGVMCLFAFHEFSSGETTGSPDDDAGRLWMLPPIWGWLYGFALHSSGFSVSRGLRLFGWLLIIASCIVFISAFVFFRRENFEFSWASSHWQMGCLFGAFQLAYGIYLYVTGEEQNEL